MEPDDLYELLAEAVVRLHNGLAPFGPKVQEEVGEEGIKEAHAEIGTALQDHIAKYWESREKRK